MCFRYSIDEHEVSSLRKGKKCERNPSGVSFTFNSRPQATRSAQQTGVPVITSKNAAQLNQVVTNLIEATDEIASKDKSKE